MARPSAPLHSCNRRKGACVLVYSRLKFNQHTVYMHSSVSLELQTDRCRKEDIYKQCFCVFLCVSVCVCVCVCVCPCVRGRNSNGKTQAWLVFYSAFSSSGISYVAFKMPSLSVSLFLPCISHPLALCISVFPFSSFSHSFYLSASVSFSFLPFSSLNGSSDPPFFCLRYPSIFPCLCFPYSFCPAIESSFNASTSSLQPP